jgi:ankyrin repeat protein
MTNANTPLRQNLHMKRMLGLTLGVLVCFTIQMRAADPLTDALQKGLVEEEANQNLDAAIKAYQDVLARAEEQRRVAATALFRLAECYRKQGKTNEATVEYRRLLRDYAEQSTLVNLSRQNLTGLGAAPTVASTTTAQPGEPLTTDEEQQEIQRIRALTKNSPDLINTHNRTYGGVRGTLLHEAAYKGHLLVAEYLLASGSDLHARDALQATPLYQAARNGHKRMVELLLAKGAQPSPPESQQPLHAAVESGFKAVVEVLLAHKVNLDVKHPKEKRQGYAPSQHEGMTALHIAIKEKNLEMAELLLSAGAELNVTYEKPRGPNPLHSLSSFDGTPLHFAVQSRNPAAVKMLLGRGADANAWSSAGLTPLHYVPNREAQTESALEIAEMLFAAGAKVNTPGNEDGELPGWTPLHIAVYHKLPNVLRLLLEKGADPNLLLPSQSGNERTALNMAVSGGVREVVELLLAHKADVNARDHNGNTPLVRSFRERHHEMVELLLSKGADPNALDASGFPPLHIALGAQQTAPPTQGSFAERLAQVKNQRTVPGFGGPPQTSPAPATPPPTTQPSPELMISELLLKYKANPNQRDKVKDKESETALHLAARTANQAAVELLLKYKADPNARTDSGITPLHWAVQAGKEELLDLLLAHNADVTAAKEDGDTALHSAAAQGLTNVVAKLVQRGADINACTRKGDTPLRQAIRISNVNQSHEYAALAFLLQAGADMLKRCDNHPSAFEEAVLQHKVYRTRPDGGLVDFLRKHHPRKLGFVTLEGPVKRNVWLWEADKRVTLYDAIAAVGLQETADPARVTINRTDPDTGIRTNMRFNVGIIRPGDATLEDVTLKHGDVIHVAERRD